MLQASWCPRSAGRVSYGITIALRGHDYGIQITTDAPHWGGLSGCTFRESESWGKYHSESMTATVYTDATIALPLLVTALAQR